jgi:glucokinase
MEPATIQQVFKSSGAGGKLVGVEIGGTKLQIVTGDGGGRITARWRAASRRAGGGRVIQRQIRDGMAALLEGAAPAAVGVGFGGPVDWRHGRVCRSHQVDGWEGFELAAWLCGVTGAAVAVENDANTGALGEALHGAGRGADPVFYVTLGSGVGGGLVAGGRIYHGAPPGEAEFGHLRLDRGPAEEATVESRCSGWAVDRRIRRLVGEQPNSRLAQLVGGAATGGEARHLAAALAANDPAAAALLSDVATDLAFALSHVVHLAHPQVIVFGGGLSLVGEPLRAAVAGALPRFVMEAFHPPPEVRLAALGEDAVPVGALELAARALTQVP